MSLFTKQARDIFSPVDAAGNLRAVQNGEVQAWGSEVERMLAVFQAGGGIIFPDLDTANASLAYGANQMAWVVGDPAPANNGVYRKIGASGSGSWVRLGDLPYSMIRLDNAGAGTADAIVAVPMLPLPTTPGAALLTVNILAPNTGNVTLNGKPLRTNSGNEIAPGGLTAGSIHAFLDLGDHFRLLSDQASGAIVAAAEVAQLAAEAAAAGLNLPSIGSGDAGKTLVVNDEEDGYELGSRGDIGGPVSSTNGAFALWSNADGSGLKDGPTIGEVQSWSLSSPQGRISLSSTDSVTQSDIASAINIHYVPCVGNRVPVLVGESFVSQFMSAPITLALDDDSGHVGYHQSGKVFDVFAIDDAGSLMIGTGPAWASSASRGSGAGTTEIESYRGLLVNKNSISIRTGTNSGDVVAIPAREATYLGSFSPTADGQASDTKTKRLVFNAYNQARRAMFQSGAAASYTYSIATWRIIGGASALRMSFLLGLDGVGVSATAVAMAMNSTATVRTVRCGIGLDTENGFANGSLATSIQATNVLNSMIARYEGYPGAGLHYLAQIEMGAGADTQTWYATDSSNYQAGMVGDFLG